MTKATRYFGPETLSFLRELRDNNNREWFQEHKAEYERVVLEPSLELIQAMGARLAKAAPMLTAEAKRQGGSLMRIYRDTRFSKDKRPLKTNIGIQFRHQAGRDIHAPGCYLHIDPAECFLGLGMWHPEADSLKKIRQAIVAQPDLWQAIVSKRVFKAMFELAGDSLKNPPRGLEDTERLNARVLEDLKRKDFIVVCQLTEQEITGSDFPGLVIKKMKVGGDFMTFLCEAIGLPY